MVSGLNETRWNEPHKLQWKAQVDMNGGRKSARECRAVPCRLAFDVTLLSRAWADGPFFPATRPRSRLAGWPSFVSPPARVGRRRIYLRLGEVDKAALLLREVLRGPLLVLPVALVLEHLNLIGAAEIIAATRRDVWHVSLATARRHHSSRPFSLHCTNSNPRTPTTSLQYLPTTATKQRKAVSPPHHNNWTSRRHTYTRTRRRLTDRAEGVCLWVRECAMLSCRPPTNRRTLWSAGSRAVMAAGHDCARPSTNCSTRSKIQQYTSGWLDGLGIGESRAFHVFSIPGGLWRWNRDERNTPEEETSECLSISTPPLLFGVWDTTPFRWETCAMQLSNEIPPLSLNSIKWDKDLKFQRKLWLNQ